MNLTSTKLRNARTHLGPQLAEQVERLRDVQRESPGREQVFYVMCGTLRKETETSRSPIYRIVAVPRRYQSDKPSIPAARSTIHD